MNLAKNKLRWRGLWRWGEIDPQAPGEGSDGPVAQAERGRREQILRRALDELDRDSRNLVLLSECAGLTTEELVAVFGWPAGLARCGDGRCEDGGGWPTSMRLSPAGVGQGGPWNPPPPGSDPWPFRAV